MAFLCHWLVLGFLIETPFVPEFLISGLTRPLVPTHIHYLEETSTIIQLNFFFCKLSTFIFELVLSKSFPVAYTTHNSTFSVCFTNSTNTLLKVIVIWGL